MEAHDVIVKDIAPDCIIGQEYQYLSRLVFILSHILNVLTNHSPQPLDRNLRLPGLDLRIC